MSSDTTRQQDQSVLHPVIRDQIARIQQRLEQGKRPFKIFEAFRTWQDPFAFANALTGIYATDPKYRAKLVKPIHQYDLTDYDINIAGGQIARADIPTPIVRDDGLVLPGGLKFGDHGEAVRGLQQMLTACGYSVGAVDGELGTLTRSPFWHSRQIMRWQRRALWTSRQRCSSTRPAVSPSLRSEIFELSLT